MMKVFDELTSKNFKLFAAQHYNNPECTDVEEFKQDLSRFKYLKRLLLDTKNMVNYKKDLFLITL